LSQSCKNKITWHFHESDGNTRNWTEWDNYSFDQEQACTLDTISSAILDQSQVNWDKDYNVKC